MTRTNNIGNVTGNKTNKSNHTWGRNTAYLLISNAPRVFQDNTVYNENSYNDTTPIYPTGNLSLHQDRLTELFRRILPVPTSCRPVFQVSNLGLLYDCSSQLLPDPVPTVTLRVTLCDLSLPTPWVRVRLSSLSHCLCPCLSLSVPLLPFLYYLNPLSCQLALIMCIISTFGLNSSKDYLMLLHQPRPRSASCRNNVTTQPHRESQWLFS